MASSRALKLVQYSASLDIEVMRFADLRRRANAGNWGSAPHRVDFCHLIIVTEGEFTHRVDFVPQACTVGSWLLIKPGQVHAFDLDSAWDGWLVVFKPEAVPPPHGRRQPNDIEDIFDALPTAMTPPTDEHGAALDIVAQMAGDAGKYPDPAEGNRLLRAALFYLLLRALLFLRHDANSPQEIGKTVSNRFLLFKKLVERDMRTQHHIHHYATRLGCSGKSLNRAVLAVAGVSAKSYLTQRIVLEAKRLLVHTTQASGAIGIELGFDEATNFVKFFKRETGTLPKAFRQRYM